MNAHDEEMETLAERLRRDNFHWAIGDNMNARVTRLRQELLIQSVASIERAALLTEFYQKR